MALILSSVKFSDGPEQLAQPEIIANVLFTPNVLPSDRILYMTVSNELRINGTGFIGAKDIDIFFDPPLVKEVAYEIVSKFPCAKDEIVLRLRHGYEWRKSAGPLYVKGINTGGGAVKVNGEGGVQVAMVRDNLPEHDVKVFSTFNEQYIYHDSATVTISGPGFNPLALSSFELQFSNDILGKGVNYTITDASETSLTLTLTPGSFWRKNIDYLPGFLTLLALDNGAGFVAIGPVNSGKGRDVAIVFERPMVYSGNTKLLQAHSFEVHIHGTGFSTAIAAPRLKFNTVIKEGVDYFINVISRNEIQLMLMDGKSWGKVGPLIVTGINVFGAGRNEAEWIIFSGSGVHVAEIVNDEGSASVNVSIIPRSIKIYQSALQRSIEIKGKGLTSGKCLTNQKLLHHTVTSFLI